MSVEVEERGFKNEPSPANIALKPKVCVLVLECLPHISLHS